MRELRTAQSNGAGAERWLPVPLLRLRPHGFSFVLGSGFFSLPGGCGRGRSRISSKNAAIAFRSMRMTDAVIEGLDPAYAPPEGRPR